MTARITAADRLAARESERARSRGLGILHPLLEEPGLTDIYVNSPDEVWTDGAEGPRRRDVVFAGEEAVRELATRLITAAGRRLDSGHPCADVQSAAGYRVHAVIPPISPESTCLSIRVQPRSLPTFEGLRAAGMLTESMEGALRGMISRRRSFIISGPSGSGKTTLLNSLLGLCGASERLVLIEDSAELRPAHPHVIRLQTREANAEGRGAVGLADLIRQSLRMGPDRIVLGECRGAEVKELFLAMNTGHEGGGGTLHANSAEAVPARLVALGALTGLTAEAVALQAVSAISVVVHLQRGPRGRFVQQIGVLSVGEAGLEVLPALSASPDGRTVIGPAIEALERLTERGLSRGEGRPVRAATSSAMGRGGERA
jgi:pilus assembly protein CpaF